jgi:NAD-reducing hydrogenase small subunit
MSKLKLATIWLDGCSGCHMSFLDLDEDILSIAEKVDLVYGPLVDVSEFPEGVDVTLVEGAVSSQEDLKKIQLVRARTRVLVALGDCAVTSNVASMRNPIPVNRLLQRVYIDGSDTAQEIPSDGVPALLPQARPVHDFVSVDVHLPGCPPAPGAILGVLSSVLAGTAASAPAARFG